MGNRKKLPKKHTRKRQKETGPPVPPSEHTAHDHGHEHGDDDVWIFTEPMLDGTGYMVTINAGKDKATTLTPDAALIYAQHLLWVASRAEYDALVAKQLYDLIKDKPLPEEPPESSVAHMVTQLREDRPPLDKTVTYPLTFEPAVNARWEPFVTVEIEGDRRLGSWDIQAARRHALGVVESVHVADLDSGYKRLLVGTVGLDEGTAGAVVHGLSDLRDMSAFF